jgi:quinol monooxygenase YgiN
MYGTIARMKVRKGAIDQLRSMETERTPKGYMGSYVFQSDEDPDELWLVVMFENKELYFANADSPEQDKEFHKLMEYMVSEPEWHDGEIVFSTGNLQQTH